jgi:predicted phage terminase large subunit-like protein
MAHQLDILRHPARNKVVVCGRRWGKTKAGELACIEGHGPRQCGFKGALDGGNIWWIAPSYGIASMIWRDLKRSLREGWEDKHENERRITLPGGGSVTVKSGDNPDSLRGDGLDGAVLDEAAFMAQEAWTACIRPALSGKRGWAMFLSTPCGLNWFYDLFTDVPNREGWARWQRPSAENPIMDAQEIAAARREIGSHLFAQEYQAEFLSASGGLFKAPYFDLRYDPVGPHHYTLPGGPTLHIESLMRFATVDLAVSTKTSADYTVIATLGRAPDGRLLLLDLDRARREGPDILPTLARTVARWRLASVWIEKTGFQLAIVQQARREGLPVRELVPDRDKVARALPLTAALEGGRVLLPRTAPWVDDLVSECLAFPGGAHDDQVDALSYGVAASRGIGSSLVLSYRPPQPSYDYDPRRGRFPRADDPWADVRMPAPW